MKILAGCSLAIFLTAPFGFSAEPPISPATAEVAGVQMLVPR